DFEFGVIQIPEKESGSGHWSWGGGFVLEVPYGAKDPEASYEFIKYLSTPEVQEKFGEKSFDIMANRTANENLVNNDNLDENGQMIYQ
ncbi:extracellular solute-binding protein, partial [Enterococcus faecalis]|nr:extracellular solute-binding protein [Enterococcus faecalis]